MSRTETTYVAVPAASLELPTLTTYIVTLIQAISYIVTKILFRLKFRSLIGHQKENRWNGKFEIQSK
ncbi:hypothetical protein BDV18DRAFT_136247 [Aspergillus unguis]